MSSRPYVSIVIPTLDESGNIRPLIRGIRAVMNSYEYEIIVIDKHSKDGTARVAEAQGARVLFDDNGKGAALIKGFAQSKGKIIIAMDADLSHRPEELKLLIAGIEAGYDMCTGSRYITGGGSDDITLIRKFGSKVFVLLINVLYNARFTDMSYGYKAFTRDAIRRLRLREPGLGIEADMHTRAMKAHLKVIEVPSFEKRREYGASNVPTIKAGWETLRTIFDNTKLRLPR